MIKIRRSNSLWSVHTHSRYSYNDALPSVEDLVTTASRMGHPALGLTDHGNMAGSVQLYKACQKAGLLPFPGSELYVVDTRLNKKAKRHHMCVVAYTTEGYRNLVRLSTLSHRNFHNKPLLDHADLAELSEQGLLRGIAGTSGCYFGEVAQAIVGDNEPLAIALLKTYAGWFDKFYIEQQNHNIDHGDGWNDDLLADCLHGLAHRLGIRTILTQDSHYCERSDKPDHEVLKRLVAFGPDADDAVFPGDGFHLADDQWFREHHPEPRFADGKAGLQDLLDGHQLQIPALDQYHYVVPVTVPDPQKELEERCARKLLALDLKGDYTERLAEELAVIRDTGMAGYLLLVAEVTDWCQANQVLYQARGSASGSMCCWLLGITQVDPLAWGLSYERFVSRDRTKPPDIDLDVEHTSRPKLVEWLSSRFAVHQIGTWLEYSLANTEEGSGSLRVKYFSRKRRSGEEVTDWASAPEQDKQQLYSLATRKALSGYGTHAAGMVLTTTHAEFDALVPQMWVASSKTMVTQYEMGDIEALGLVKLDVLGLKTLSVLHTALSFLDKDVFAGLDWIPLTDRKTYATMGRGDTDGVFQLEGGSSRWGVRDLKPSKIHDVIASMALFRPATMESGATAAYIRRRKKEEQPPTRHPIIHGRTKDTYGIMLFQEQVIGILREIGMNPDDLTEFLKAVKASQKSEIAKAWADMARYRETLHQMATTLGMAEEDWTWLWEAIEGFAKYGFNKAHSTAYGITAYRTAYLVTNHPIEYHAALLSVAAGTDKEAKYIAATRKRGISIYGADINKSDVKYTVDRRGVRKGLQSIKGVGEKAAVELVAKRPAAGYSSLSELCDLVNPSIITGIKPYLVTKDLGVGVLNKLYEAGALNCLDDVIGGSR